MTKRNAIIMAAGTSSRFVPLSYEYPKGLVEVKGEVLIERQIRQLIEAGIDDITIVVGYKAELFLYLKEKYKVKLVMNEDFSRYNNTSSMIRVVDLLDNTFVCCSDHYFSENVFLKDTEDSYYSALYADGETNEYCLSINNAEEIIDVSVGGHDAWYMIGHVYFNHEFSDSFRKIMIEQYQYKETKQWYWEDVYIRFINLLPKLKINRYNQGEIFEFDSLDELRQFDRSYMNNTRSIVLRQIAKYLDCEESCLHSFKPEKGEGLVFSFFMNEVKYIFDNNIIRKC